jgi:hypothetical protein
MHFKTVVEASEEEEADAPAVAEPLECVDLRFLAANPAEQLRQTEREIEGQLKKSAEEARQEMLEKDQHGMVLQGT